MGNASTADTSRRGALASRTAADLMTPNPLSIREDATLTEAVAFLTDKGFSAAPVMNETGRPVGVLSGGDILTHERERLERLNPVRAAGEPDPARVRDLMTPALFSVAPEVSACGVARQMVELNVHHLFVVDQDGVLLGVISALDILRHLCAEEQEATAQAFCGGSGHEQTSGRERP